MIFCKQTVLCLLCLQASAITNYALMLLEVDILLPFYEVTSVTR